MDFIPDKVYIDGISKANHDHHLPPATLRTIRHRYLPLRRARTFGISRVAYRWKHQYSPQRAFSTADTYSQRKNYHHYLRPWYSQRESTTVSLPTGIYHFDDGGRHGSVEFRL